MCTCEHVLFLTEFVWEPFTESHIIYGLYLHLCVSVCTQVLVGNLVNHFSTAHANACVPSLPRGLSLPAVLLRESEVSPLELPSALICS